ncbi:MAG TPA: serine hydrolase domain-containing protein [Lachnospiraceae bacterium]|nr:serine hydrolase domain-containing protein [Lachnospiraceae bacterium]
MQKIVNKIIDDFNFRGCISIKKGNNDLVQESRGYADLANQLPNEMDTRFATASAGKVFVSVGILQLIEQGRLSFHSTIGELLDIDLHEIDDKITVEELLCHTSGIPDYFDETVMEEYEELWRDYPNYKIRTSADILPLFIDKPMMYPRGERFQYNNTGFVVLGLIIEKVTGELFDEYLRKNVFEPCGMLHTGYYELDRLPAKCANSYIYDETRQEYYTNIYSVDVKGTGAGGAFTTVLDIERFWECLFSGKLISKEMLQQMLSVHASDEEEGDYYGYGIWLNKIDEGRYVPFFQGCDPGVSFITSYDIDVDTSITLVSNYGDNVWRLLYEIRNQGL